MQTILDFLNTGKNDNLRNAVGKALLVIGAIKGFVTFIEPLLKQASQALGGQ